MLDRIDIGQEGEAFVKAELENGRHTSASDVVREALHLLKMQREEEAELSELARSGIERGLADVAAGRVTPWEDVRAELDAIISDSEAKL